MEAMRPSGCNILSFADILYSLVLVLWDFPSNPKADQTMQPKTCRNTTVIYTETTPTLIALIPTYNKYSIPSSAEPDSPPKQIKTDN